MDKERTSKLGEFLTKPKYFGEHFGWFVPCCREAPYGNGWVSDAEDGEWCDCTDCAAPDCCCHDEGCEHAPRPHPAMAKPWYEFAKALKAKLESDASVFSCNDFTLATPLVRVAGKEYDITDADAVKAMAAAMAPTPFGDLATQTTRVDAAVRDALYVDASAVEPLFVDAQCLADTVAGHFGADVEVVPYRFNLYWTGGHFQEHVDTPLDPARTIGTAVAMYSAGDEYAFQLRHPDTGREHVFKAKPTVVVYEAHVPHSVPAVKGAYRVSMVYSILRREGAPTKRMRTMTDMTQLVQERVDARGPFALVTTKRYTFAAHEEYGDAMLRRQDRTLFDAVAQCATLKCAIVFVAFTCETESEYQADIRVTTNAVFYVSRETINRGLARMMDPPQQVDDAPLNPFPRAVDCLYIPRLCKARKHTLHENEAGITGNECCEGSSAHLYQNAALVFYNPARTQLRGQVLK